MNGYNQEGRLKERVMSDREIDSYADMVSGVTIPISQMLFPTINAENSLKHLGKELKQLNDPDKWVGTLDRNIFHVSNNGASGEGIFIIDESNLPSQHVLGIDINIYERDNKPNFTGMTSLSFEESMLYPNSFSINRGLSRTTACVRIFSMKFGDKPENLRHIVATCFNKESIDLFQLKKIML